MYKTKIAMAMMVTVVLAAVTRGEVGTIAIKKAAQKPVIDGKLVDACWLKQTALDRFTLNDSDATPAKKQTKAYICYDDKNIYVAIRCQEPDIAKIGPGSTERDYKHLYTNDCVEVFISPRLGVYYHFLLTTANTLLDTKGNYEIGEDGYVRGGFSEFKLDRSWNCEGFNSATSRGKDSWSAEMSIPFARIGGVPKAGAKWTVNIAREEKHLGELSTFSPLFGAFHQPEAFSKLTFQKDAAVLVRASKEFDAINVTPGAKQTAKQADPVVFVTNYLQRGCPTTLPKPGEITDTVELFASLGEYEPATFSVRAGAKPLERTKITIAGDLKAKAGAVISQKNVEVRVVESWKRWVTTRKYMYMERYLQKKAAVDIPRHTTQRFWLTVHVPDNAKGGVYRSKIVITAGGKTLKTLKLNVEVLPFEVKPGEGVGYFMYLPPWGIPAKLRTQEYLRKIFVDMREHGMTTVTLYRYGLPFALVMDIVRDTKLIKPGMPAIWLGADVVGPDRWKKILDEGKKRNWPELLFYMQDEPGDPERNENARRLMKMLADFKKKNPQYKSVRTTTAIGSAGIKAVGDLYDIWICSSGALSKDTKLAERANRTGKLLWTYDCGLAPVDAETNRYYFGLWSWKLGVKGASLWAYVDCGNPTGTRDWDYIDNHLPDLELPYSFVYPSADELVPSVGWEAVREGIDDYKYVVTLFRLINRAKAAGRKVPAEAAWKVLKDTADKVHIGAYFAATRAGSATGRRLGGHFDRPSPERKISKGDYNAIRYRIAREIMKLQKLMEQ